MDKISNTSFKKGTVRLTKLYVLVSIATEKCDSGNVVRDNKITEKDLETYFKANSLLQYGILGYAKFPLKVVHLSRRTDEFIIETSTCSLSKLQLIIANHFPSESPIKFSTILNSENNFAFKVRKIDVSLASIIHGDLKIEPLNVE
ncbi:hypothetical protein BEWA_019880 [Theileria equi strain WA]|uniref:Uncharacterized protein n=1 Tax=Theileria equi strain WA TaxID=1537102 RepID=L0AU21_THEEQ|nr:hypothetical protein BEWA_019880 [Theileria equi strain WA]AFZ79142.1 hypothetical protein BEWA_019880 [Theileria equi strain WA]|eukprot:XP_004828808.1 hypothetical protein BEWA_019880 [Theileria equi strain WA]